MVIVQSQLFLSNITAAMKQSLGRHVARSALQGVHKLLTNRNGLNCLVSGCQPMFYAAGIIKCYQTIMLHIAELGNCLRYS